jgi:ACT domain
MSQLVRLRLELADSPGSLAKVAGMIAAHGGNITAVDVQDAHPKTAVDEIVAEFPDTAELGLLRQELASSGVAILLSHQAAQRSDPLVQVLRHAVELLRAPSFSPDEELTRAIAELCSSPSVLVTDGDEAFGIQAGRFALERNFAVTLRTNQVPAGMQATLFDEEVWLLAVPDTRTGRDRRVVFVARPLAMDFTATEITRIEALMALHDELARLRVTQA